MIDDLPQPDFIDENDHQALAIYWRKYASEAAAQRWDLRGVLRAISLRLPSAGSAKEPTPRRRCSRSGS